MRRRSMPSLTPAAISLELLQDCLGTLEQLATGITNLGVDATSDPSKAPRVMVLLAELLMSLQQCENDLGIYSPGPVDL
jgi:hypothetical protein